MHSAFVMEEINLSRMIKVYFIFSLISQVLLNDASVVVAISEDKLKTKQDEKAKVCKDDPPPMPITIRAIRLPKRRL